MEPKICCLQSDLDKIFVIVGDAEPDMTDPDHPVLYVLVQNLLTKEEFKVPWSATIPLEELESMVNYEKSLKEKIQNHEYVEV